MGLVRRVLSIEFKEEEVSVDTAAVGEILEAFEIPSLVMEDLNITTRYGVYTQQSSLALRRYMSVGLTGRMRLGTRNYIIQNIIRPCLLTYEENAGYVHVLVVGPTTGRGKIRLALQRGRTICSERMFYESLLKHIEDHASDIGQANVAQITRRLSTAIPSAFTQAQLANLIRTF